MAFLFRQLGFLQAHLWEQPFLPITGNNELQALYSREYQLTLSPWASPGSRPREGVLEEGLQRARSPSLLFSMARAALTTSPSRLSSNLGPGLRLFSSRLISLTARSPQPGHQVAAASGDLRRKMDQCLTGPVRALARP